MKVEARRRLIRKDAVKPVHIPGELVSHRAAYTADVNGNVASVLAGRDVQDLEGWGAQVNDSALSPSANGLYAVSIPLLTARNSDGSVLAAAAAAGKFGVSVTLGTSRSKLAGLHCRDLSPGTDRLALAVHVLAGRDSHSFQYR